MVIELELTNCPRKPTALDKASSRSNKTVQGEEKDKGSSGSAKPSSLKLNDN